MKSLKLLGLMLVDSSIRCGVSTSRDYISVCKRVKDEGESFLTISLPNFGKDFLLSLDRGSASLLFTGFRKRGQLPVLLGGLLDLIFDRCSGDLLHKPSVDAIYCVHCICNLHKKIESDCTPEREAAAFTKFLEVERELNSFDPSNTDEFKLFGIVSDYLWGSVCRRVERQVCNLDLLGRHGPGATAERISGNRKYDIISWPTRLEAYFPFDHMCMVNWNWSEVLGPVTFVEPEAETPVRVISVPKTLKAPRIIAIEPVAMQYCQQSLLNLLRPSIETHRLTAGRINFSDQTVNASQALASSKDGLMATLDLSDASDRVSSVLVYRMLHSVPHLRSAVFACRSTRADVPGYGIVPLSKFASMGSALCFEMESMVFYTILIASLLRDRSLRPSASNIARLSKEVRVYGDDLIIPTDNTSTAIEYLETLGLRVNRSKTFSGGKFRESCGMDAYDGSEVTPIYCRTKAPNSRRDAHAVASWTALSNQLHAGGFWRSADAVRTHLESVLGLEIPLGTDQSSGLVLTSFLRGQSVHGWNRHLHVPTMKTVRLRPKLPRSRASAHGSLLKCLARKGNVPFDDPLHLERAGRPLRLDIVVGRVSHTS